MNIKQVKAKLITLGGAYFGIQRDDAHFPAYEGNNFKTDWMVWLHIFNGRMHRDSSGKKVEDTNRIFGTGRTLKEAFATFEKRYEAYQAAGVSE